MISKTSAIILNILPIVFMIAGIPVIKNDYILTAFYLLVIIAAFVIRKERKDYLFFIFGVIIMSLSELFFINTGVETFLRRSFLGAIPIWLPVLWGYCFVGMKRVIVIILK
ncbi:MAG: hypothetical protein WCL61_03975 [bacterium]